MPNTTALRYQLSTFYLPVLVVTSNYPAELTPFVLSLWPRLCPRTLRNGDVRLSYPFWPWFLHVPQRAFHLWPSLPLHIPFRLALTMTINLTLLNWQTYHNTQNLVEYDDKDGWGFVHDNIVIDDGVWMEFIVRYCTIVGRPAMA